MATIFEFAVNNTQVISGYFRTTGAGNAITVDWGDGSATKDFAGTTDQNYSKDYGSAGNRTVTITAADESVMTHFTMTRAGADISFALSDLPSGVTNFVCYGLNTVSGSLADLPSGVEYFSCAGSNTVSGSLADLPSGLTYFYCTGSNTVSGSLAGLPSGLTYFLCMGSNTVSGSLDDLPSGVTYFRCSGSNTVTKGSARTWNSTMDRVYLSSSASTGGLSDKDVDDLLNELADVTTWTGSKEVIITTNQGKRSVFSDTAATALTAALSTFSTNGRIDDIDSGTLTAGTLYRIGKTEVNHFGTGLVVGDYFVSDGTETCDANNTVLKVFAPSTSGVTVVSEKEGSTQNWLTKDAGFAYNEASYRVIVREYA